MIFIRDQKFAINNENYPQRPANDTQCLDDNLGKN